MRLLSTRQIDEEDAYNPPFEDTIAKRLPSSPLANEVTTPENYTNKPNFQVSEIGIGCVSQMPSLDPEVPVDHIRRVLNNA